MKNPSCSQNIKSFEIPVWVQTLSLSLSEKFLLSLILSLDNQSHCFASNIYLAERTGLSSSRISYYINKFKKLGLIKQLNSDNEKRKLEVIIIKSKPEKENYSKKDSYAKTRRGGTCFHDSPHIYRELQEEKQQTEDVVVVSFEEEKRRQLLESKGLKASQFKSIPIFNLEASLAAADQYAKSKPVLSYQALCAKAIREHWKPNEKALKKEPPLHPTHQKCKDYLDDHKYLFSHDYLVKENYFFKFEEDRFYFNYGESFQPIYYDDKECFEILKFGVNKMKKQKEIL